MLVYEVPMFYPRCVATLRNVSVEAPASSGYWIALSLLVGLDFNLLEAGTQGGMKIREKQYIYGHIFRHGSLPPVNKIFS